MSDPGGKDRDRDGGRGNESEGKEVRMGAGKLGVGKTCWKSRLSV